MSEEIEVPEPGDYDIAVAIYSRFQPVTKLGEGGYTTVGHQEVKVKKPAKEPEPILSLAEMMKQLDKEAQKV
ncbi:MAG: hypothetical protein MUO24_03550 [Desulfobacterales bacterium]|nr:hypothetical protein [Desulfobacterales bacterium]